MVAEPGAVVRPVDGDLAKAPRTGGLTSAEVHDRVERGLVNGEPEGTGRSIAEILRANIFTRFNAILGGLLAVIIVVGPFQDALFGVVLVLNTAIGILQELRARHTLARLSLVKAPRARVERDGEEQAIPVPEVVQDDLVLLQPGDQLPADGLLETGEVEIDESLLTGEAEPVDKTPGEDVLSGSFVVAGSGSFRVTAVGAQAFAFAITQEARRFTLTSSELQRGINKILRLVTWAIPPVAILLGFSQLSNLHLSEALRSSVAGVGAMIPEGLVLLTSLAFSVAVIRLGRRRVLTKELPAVEGLARVDVACLDKTGTITEGKMAVSAIETLELDTDAELVLDALAALVAAEPHPNTTLQAVADATEGRSPGWTVTDRMPFSSARKWSGARFDGKGTWVLGAPEMLQREGNERAADLAAEGNRVLLLGRSEDERLDPVHAPSSLTAVALVVLHENVRPDAPDTLAFFAREGVAVKIISGDNPVTVAAVAARAGVPNADNPVDGRDLPEDENELADIMESASVFGRVQPRQKRAMVKALQSRGHVVAMTGDGVNDVIALKEADIGVAMGSGSEAARGVAQLVLLDDDFSVVPAVVAEGRRVIANVERVANLFITKTVYAMLLAIAVGAAGFAFPFLPRHLTIVSGLTIGIPAFFLALAPNHQRFRPGFVGRVLRFAVPAGIVAAAATFTVYAVVRDQPDVSLTEARTSATLVLFAIGMAVLVLLERPMTMPRRGLTLGLVGVFAVVILTPALREFFELELPPVVDMLAAVGVAAMALFVLDTGWKVAALIQQRRGAAEPPSPDTEHDA